MPIEHVVVFLLAVIVVLLWRYIMRKKPDSPIGSLVIVDEPDGDRNVFLRVSQGKLDGQIKPGETISFSVVYESYEDFINSHE